MIHSFLTITEGDYEVINVVQRYNLSHFSTVYFFNCFKLVHDNPNPQIVGSPRKPRALDETRGAIHTSNLVLEWEANRCLLVHCESCHFRLILIGESVEPVWDATDVNPYIAGIRLVKVCVSKSTIRAI
jgi:hypothetical protein